MPVNMSELALSTKQSRILKSSMLSSPGTPMWATQNLKAYAEEAYTHNPDAYACITLKQFAVAGIPVHVYKTDSEDIETDVKNPFVTLIKRPNPEQGWPRFAEHMVGDLEYSGNLFIERTGPDKYEKTRPREMYCLPPKDMEIIRGDARNPVEGYKYGSEIPFKAWQILHLNYYNPLDYFWGLSPLSACSHAIDQNNAAANWNYALFKNSGRPSGILTLQEEVVDETSFDDIVAKMRKQYTGEGNAGQVMVLTGDMKWTTTSFSPTDMDFRNMSVLNTRKIAASFGVPPQLIGEETSKTYSNYAEARQAFYIETVLPLMDWIVGELNNWLSPLYGGNYELRYDRAAVEALQENTNQRYDRVLRAVAGGVLTPLEGRKVLGYELLPDDPDQDKRLIPWNLAPEGQQSQMAIQQQQQFGGGGQQQQQTKQPKAGRPTNAEKPPIVNPTKKRGAQRKV
jgi:HK97 family phage portal protein